MKRNNNGDFKMDATRAFDNLIRAAGAKESAGFTRPSNEAIQAYLEGRANEKMRAEMQEALLASASFRKEMAELAQDLEYIEGQKAADDFGKVKISGKNLARIKGLGKPGILSSCISRSSDALVDGITWLSNFFRPPAIRMATAGAGVVAGAIIVATIMLSQAQLVPMVAMGNSASLPVSTFGVTRGEASDEGQEFDWAAAKDSFDEMIKVVDGAVEIDKRAPAAASTSDNRTVKLLLASESDKANERLETTVPKEVDSLKVWVLLVPRSVSSQMNEASAQFVIKQQQVNRNKVKIVWDPQVDAEEALITLTYKIDNKFFATHAMYIRI